MLSVAVFGFPNTFGLLFVQLVPLPSLAIHSVAPMVFHDKITESPLFTGLSSVPLSE
jgi:hypothetical protein